MAKTVTLRLSESVYEAVKHYAEADQKSMNAWIETLLDAEDMRRRCAAHDRWMREHPDAAAFSEAWADRNLAELTKR
ncbi:toxin-antitoxin system HicB family antitoxin [Mycobacterium avium]|uniref:toxin-antitoxin system HicB family antitoxin n=1 Tax=Mycobacterium avium TaxID=1764 RepID=UPI0009FD15C0|nr:toxin-antitoxin system HicB family antitoxin [Mycobacterium avium]